MMMRLEGTEPGQVSVRLVKECLTAIRDYRVGDLLTLVDPEVVCYPLVRPGLFVYRGHEGMASLTRDMHRVHGEYQVEFGDIAVRDGGRVTVQAAIVPGPDRVRGPLAFRAEFVFRDGRITRIDSYPGAGAASADAGRIRMRLRCCCG
jgi:SnoaL-like domain